MKSIKGFVLEGCAYTVILTFILYIFLAITGVGSSGVPFLKFLLVFGYGFLFPIANLLRNHFKSRPMPATLLHYVTLLLGFIIVYLLNAGASTTSGNIFVAIFLFTLVYAIWYGIKIAIRHFTAKKPVVGKGTKKTKKSSSDTYTPRFGS